ncbi:MAG: UvrD-helicase domain-containing protein, partial [Pseudomonadota bacterium]
MSISEFKPIRKFVQAGAGAGKTWNLTREVVHFAIHFRGETGQWPRVVLTTFTRKATQELKERLLKLCLEERPEALEFVQSGSYLSITTMHGLLGQFLSQYGFHLGLPSQFKVVEPKVTLQWRKQVLKSLLYEENQFPELSRMTAGRLLGHLKGYESLYWQGLGAPVTVDDFDELCGLLCEKQGEELSEICRDVEASVEGDDWDQYCQKLRDLIGILGDSIPWPKKKEMLESLLTQLKKPREVGERKYLDDNQKKNLKKKTDDIKKLTQDPDLDPQFWPQIAQVARGFEKLAVEYCARLFERKQSESALETDDLEFLSARLCREHSDASAAFSRSIDGWFIDEFQDTSPLQLSVLEQLIGDTSCYIVGDPQQSIYLFRGSRAEVFENKKAKMSSENAQMIALTDNYRSQKYLLNFFNEFFTKLNLGFTEMNPKKEPLEGFPVEFHHCQNDEEMELHFLGERIAQLLEEGVNAGDIGILCRGSKELDRIHRFLQKNHFPVMSHSAGRFQKRRETLDALALLQFLMNPWDNTNLLVLLRSPWVGLDDQDLLERVPKANEAFWPVFRKFFEETDHPAGRVLRSAHQLKKDKGVGWAFRRSLVELGFFDYSQKIDSSGRREANLWKLVNQVEKISREPGGRLLELSRGGAIGQTLEDVGQDGDATPAFSSERIQLMTVHKSKGLQFKFVFLPFLHKTPLESRYMDFLYSESIGKWSLRIPGSVEKEFVGSPLEKWHVDQLRGRERQESLRVFYVAVTRASDRLFLSWTDAPKPKSWALFIEEYMQLVPSSDFYSFKEWDEFKEIQWTQDREKPVLVEPFQALDPKSLEIVDQKLPYPVSDWNHYQSSQQRRWQGVVMHRVLETLKDHPPQKALECAELWMPGHGEAIAEAIGFLFSTDQAPVSEIIKNGEVEWGYSRTDDKGMILERRIDLWGIVGETLFIVDYKTGSTEF